MTTNIQLPHFKLPHFQRRHIPTAIRSGTVFVLTPLGKQKADSFGLDGVKFEVLSIMAESGPCTIDEISNELGKDDRKVKAIMKALVRSGYVRVASNEE